MHYEPDIRVFSLSYLPELWVMTWLRHTKLHNTMHLIIFCLLNSLLFDIHIYSLAMNHIREYSTLFCQTQPASLATAVPHAIPPVVKPRKVGNINIDNCCGRVSRGLLKCLDI